MLFVLRSLLLKKTIHVQLHLTYPKDLFDIFDINKIKKIIIFKINNFKKILLYLKH